MSFSTGAVLRFGVSTVVLLMCILACQHQNPSDTIPDQEAALRMTPDSTRYKWYQGQRKEILSIAGSNPTLALTQTLDLLSKETTEDSITAKWYALAVYLYTQKNEYQKAIELGEKAIELLHRFDCKTGFASCYNNLGYGLYNTGEYRSAIRYLSLAYQTLPLEGQALHAHKACENLALSYCALGMYDKADSILTQGDTDGYMPAFELAFHRGIVARDRGHFGEALHYFQQAGQTEETQRFIAFCMARMNQFGEAQQQFQSALKLAKSRRNGTESGKILWGLADLSLQKKEYKEAIRRADLVFDFLQRYRDTLHTEQAFSLPERLEWLIQTLQLRGDSWYGLYTQTQQVPYLDSAAVAYTKAIWTSDSLCAGFREELSAVEMRSSLYTLYEKTIRLYFELKKHRPAETDTVDGYIFMLVEKAKAYALRAAIRESTAEKRLLPTELFLQRRSLRARLANFMRDNNADSILSVQTALRRSDEMVRASYPALKTLSKDAAIVHGLPSIRSQLGAEEAILEWFIGDSVCIAVGITAREVRFFQTPRSASLDNLIVATNGELSGTSVAEGKVGYTRAAHDLFQQLAFSPVAFFRNQGVKRIYMVPDGPLWRIPFDALPENISGKPDSYLVDDFTLSYSWSAALWLESRLKMTRTTADQNYAGFAPIYGVAPNNTHTMLYSTSRTDLPVAREMVSTAAQQFNGDAWLEKAATKSMFMKVAPRYAVLHLAMHGLADIENSLRSGLAFYDPGNTSEDSLLTASEIYNLDLHANLVVLSACNTGTGDIQRGEGVMSLSRAFTSAGCPSTAMTLWSIPEEATSDLVTLFFKHLQEGMPKDKALSAAKLDFLRNPRWVDYQHPYYWSGLMLTGDTTALPVSTSTTQFWATIVVVGLLLFLLIYYFRTKNKKRH